MGARTAPERRTDDDDDATGSTTPGDDCSAPAGAGGLGLSAGRASPAVEPTALAGLALLATDAAADGPGRAERRGVGPMAGLDPPSRRLARRDASTLPEPGWPTPLACSSGRPSAASRPSGPRPSAGSWPPRAATIPRIERRPDGPRHDARRLALGRRDPLLGRAHGAWPCWPWRARAEADHPRAVEGVRRAPRPGDPGGRLEPGQPGRLRHAAPPAARPRRAWPCSRLARAGGRRRAGRRPGDRLPPRGPGRDPRAGLAGLGAARPPGLGRVPDEARELAGRGLRRTSSRPQGRAVELALLLLAADERSLEVLGIVHAEREVPADALTRSPGPPAPRRRAVLAGAAARGRRRLGGLVGLRRRTRPDWRADVFVARAGRTTVDLAEDHPRRPGRAGPGPGLGPGQVGPAQAEPGRAVEGRPARQHPPGAWSGRSPRSSGRGTPARSSWPRARGIAATPTSSSSSRASGRSSTRRGWSSST